MRVPFIFFAAAALCVTGGMVWGIIMAASGDHALASAHAHLNLVGWVTLALFGVYYQLTPQAAATRLAKAHVGLALLGVALMVPGIVMVLTQRGEGVAIAGSMITLASMLVFLFTVVRHGFGQPA